MSGFMVYWLIGVVLVGATFYAPGLRKRFEKDPDLQILASFFDAMGKTHGPNTAGGLAAGMFLMATLFWLPSLIYIIVRQDQ